MKNRSPINGTIGVNGEFYRGGLFLPSNPDRAKGMSADYRSMKREIEPYKWAEYKGVLKDGEKVKGFYEMLSEDQRILMKHYGSTDEQIEAVLKPYREAYNSGKRFCIFKQIMDNNECCQRINIIRFE
jgi:hypothetical protein